MRPLRHLLRMAGAFLILLGLGTSMLEGMGCANDANDAAVQVTNFPAEGSADSDSPEAPTPNVPHCCPCIHSYPPAFRVAIVPVPPLVGYPTVFGLDLQEVSDQHPQPLVPPPIA